MFVNSIKTVSGETKKIFLNPVIVLYKANAMGTIFVTNGSGKTRHNDCMIGMFT